MPKHPANIGYGCFCQALPIFLDGLVVAWGAVLISVTLILLFGEVRKLFLLICLNITHAYHRLETEYTTFLSTKTDWEIQKLRFNLHSLISGNNSDQILLLFSFPIMGMIPLLDLVVLSPNPAGLLHL